jgi:DNA-directed RNA polymerase subunit alpha
VSVSSQLSPARMEFAPLKRGFGHTFGNSLRRVLLSSLPGAAVTAVRVAGVQHELSTVPGVREDMTDVVLNLRQLVCVLDGEDEVTARLDARGPGVATAADIELPAGLEILNPELELAHLGPGSHLELELTVSRGSGYRPAAGVGQAPGVIAVDAHFSPIKRVGFQVSSERVGESTDYERLALEVTTDGSLSAEQAVSEAASILIEELTQFLGQASAPTAQERPEPTTDPLAEWRLVEIEELGLGVRSYNCLRRVGVTTVAELAAMTPAELERVPSFGAKSLQEVEEALAERGLGLAVRQGAPTTDREDTDA